VLGFPCNQFGNQEPGTNEDIKKFVRTKYNVTFPMFSKIEVNGAQEHPLFTYLKKGVDIKWNFEKFLCDRSGQLVKRYLTSQPPESFKSEILRLLYSQSVSHTDDSLL